MVRFTWFLILAIYSTNTFSTTIADVDSDDSDEYGEFSSLFTYQQYTDIILNQRVRREIRDLPLSEWNEIVDAMTIMKTLSEEEGQSIYGKHFRNIDSLTCQHSKAVYNLHGDMGHTAPVFFTFHRALSLNFELSLKSINPNISSMPYWNYKRDLDLYGYNLSNSIIFSDEYLGSFTGNRSLNYAVTDGPFAYWRVANNDTLYNMGGFGDFTKGCMGKPNQNAFGLMRSSNNNDNNPYFTRIGGHTCDTGGINTNYENPIFGNMWLGLAQDYDVCLTNTSSLLELIDCFYVFGHAAAHMYIGGTQPRYDGQIAGEWPFCTSWAIETSVNQRGVDRFVNYIFIMLCTCRETNSNAYVFSFVIFVAI